jgi:hypothetical protein
MPTIKFKELELKVDNYYDDEDFESYDYLNIKKKRNADNTDTEDYNCGGYAFETYSWYSPYNTDFDERCDEVRDFLRNGGSVEDAFEVFLQVDTESMLEDFEGRLRVVESERAIIKDDEVLIAYRLRIIPRYNEDGEIYVEGMNEDYQIFDAFGRLVYIGRGSVLSLPRGVYVVVIGNEVQKIVL